MGGKYTGIPKIASELAAMLLIWTEFVSFFRAGRLLLELAFLLSIIVTHRVLFGDNSRAVNSLTELIQPLLFTSLLISTKNPTAHGLIHVLAYSTLQCYVISLAQGHGISLLLPVISILRLFYTLPELQMCADVVFFSALYTFVEFFGKRRNRVGFSDSVFFIQVLTLLIHLPSLFTFPLDTSISLTLEKKGINVNVPLLMLSNPFYHIVILLLAVFSILYVTSSRKSIFSKSLVVPLTLVYLYRISDYLNLFWFNENFNSFDSIPLVLRFYLDYSSLKVIALWLIASSLFIFGIFLNLRLCKDTERTTRTRKWFHFLLSANALIAFYYGEELLFITTAFLITVLLTFVELLRVNGIFFARVSKLYRLFKSEHIEEKLEISHISLFLGTTIPVIHEFVKGEAVNWTKAGLGVCTVGIGDSFAALVGSTSKSSGLGKTLRGSAAYFVSCMTTMLLLSYAQDGHANVGKCALTSVLTCILEANLTDNDNVVLPLLAILVYQ